MTRSAASFSKVADPQQWMLPAWPWTLRAVAISCLLAAEISNTFQIDDHFSHWFAAGILTIMISAAEGGLSVLLMLRSSELAYRAAVVISFLMMSVWIVGLPFGPDVGRSEALQHTNLEPTALLTTAVAALLPLAASPRLRTAAAHGRGRGGSFVAGASVVLIVAVFAILAHRLVNLGGAAGGTRVIHLH
ncbi:MAG: hypothetical protein QOE89_2047 [Pseudonocardiales bacterium]|jgi:hypothetical protein|nr:hypothetical protein [Pseudonocardiales bacterium]